MICLSSLLTWLSWPRNIFIFFLWLFFSFVWVFNVWFLCYWTLFHLGSANGWGPYILWGPIKTKPQLGCLRRKMRWAGLLLWSEAFEGRQWLGQLVNTAVCWSFQLGRFTFLPFSPLRLTESLPIGPNVSCRGPSPGENQSHDLGLEQLWLLAQWSPVMSKGQKDSGYWGGQDKTC